MNDGPMTVKAWHDPALEENTYARAFFEQLKPEQTAVIISWLHGYYRDEKDPPVIDIDGFKSDLAQFGTYCAANPSVSIITAADKVMGK